jgi:hypothetical protein
MSSPPRPPPPLNHHPSPLPKLTSGSSEHELRSANQREAHLEREVQKQLSPVSKGEENLDPQTPPSPTYRGTPGGNQTRVGDPSVEKEVAD